MGMEPTRRQVLGWGAGAAAAFLGLTACGGSGGGGAPGTTELRLTWWGAPATHQRQQAAADAATKAAPHLTFRTEYSTADAYWDKLATQVAGGSAPDIISMDWSHLTEYATRGALEPLDAYSPAKIDLSDMDQQFLETGRIDGKLYGIGRGATIPAFLLDSTVLEQAGIPLPPNDWSWDDFADYAVQIHNTVGGDFYGSEDASEDYNTLHLWLRVKGHSLYDGQRLGFPEEALAEWFTFWARMRDTGGCVPPNVQVSYNSGVQSSPLVTGKAAILSLNHDTLMNFEGLTDHTVVPALPPLEGSKALFAMPASMLSVYSRSENKEAAAEAVGILVSDIGVSKVYGLESGPPPSKSLVQQIRSGELKEQERRLLDYTDLVNSGYADNAPPPPPTGSGDVSSLLQRVAQDIAFGRTDIPTGVSAFFTESSRMLSA